MVCRHTSLLVRLPTVDLLLVDARFQCLTTNAHCLHHCDLMICWLLGMSSYYNIVLGQGL